MAVLNFQNQGGSMAFSWLRKKLGNAQGSLESEPIMDGDTYPSMLIAQNPGPQLPLPIIGPPRVIDPTSIYNLRAQELAKRDQIQFGPSLPTPKPPAD